MLVLKDRVEIHAHAGDVYEWFRNLEDNYRDWHPDHVSCRYVRGNPLQIGSVLCAEEYLHGQLHKLSLKLTSVEPGRAFDYHIAPGLRGGFRISPTTSGAELQAELCIGWSLPIIGPLGDFVVKKFFTAKLKDLRTHMSEEGQNLSRILDVREKAPTHQV